MIKTYAEINERIARGEAVIVTAEELLDLVDEKGIEATAEYVDVVTTATFGPMCSSGAFLNFGHSSPPIRMTKTFLNGVEAYAGIAAVDAYIGATQVAENNSRYGGAHVIYDLVDGKSVTLHATSPGTDCYPSRHITAQVSLADLNEAYLFNPRNAYQNYNAAINTSNRTIHTYMGRLKPNCGNINYSTTGQLSPLLKDPYYRAIGVGTRIFLAGAQGYVAWMGTQFNSASQRDKYGIPTSPAGTIATVGNLKEMSTKYLRPVIFEGYGISMFIGIGIPIPVLDIDMLRNLATRDSDIYTSIVDYGTEDGSHPVIKRVSYAALRSGFVEVQGKMVKTYPLSSIDRSRDIAKALKEWIIQGEFYLQEPIEFFPANNKVKKMTNFVAG